MARMPIIRRRRSRNRKRRWLPWLIVIAAVGLLALGTCWLVALQGGAPSAPSRIVRITHTANDGLRLEGEPVTLAALETRLERIKADSPDLAVLLDGTTDPNGAVATLLGRLDLPWLSASEPLSDRRAQADGDEGPHERR